MPPHQAGERRPSATPGTLGRMERAAVRRPAGGVRVPHRSRHRTVTLVHALVIVVLAGGLSALPLPSFTDQAGAALVRPHALSPGPVPRGATARGAVPGSQRLTVSVILPPSNQPALNALLRDLYDPASSDYHHWLEPGQFRANFGPAATTVAAVTAWLRGDGFSPSVSGYQVTIQAPASKVAGTLGIGFERYHLPAGGQGYLATSTPRVPATLAGGQISSILGLNTVERPSPDDSPTEGKSPARAAHALAPDADGVTPCSDATAAAGSRFYTLDQMGAAYGIGSLLDDGETGTGQTIGLYELGQSSAEDIDTYKDCFGLTNSFSVQPVDGGAVDGDTDGDPGATAEADLDAEQAMTQAPGAGVVSYEGPNTAKGVYDVWNAIVSQPPIAQIVSTSWSLCELFTGPSQISALTTLFQQAMTQGQTIFAASGDSGSEACFQVDGMTEDEDVGFPASDALVTAAGGTSLVSPGDQPVWNDCRSSETVSCGNQGGGASGGGLSMYVCKPSWQPSVQSGPMAQPCGTAYREVPDLSANAGVGMIVYANHAWAPFVGTSFVAPFRAGMVADTNEGCGQTAGLYTPLLYGLYGLGSYGSAFGDVTPPGDNDLTGADDGQYPALVGYDLASGIGVPLASGLTCAEVTSVGAGSVGADVTVDGLGLEHATIAFGPNAATVLSATATSATVVVPPGTGTVAVTASSLAGGGVQPAQFTYPAAPAPPASPSPPPTTSIPPPAPQHGYWLVGSDGGIFTFGAAQFFGSTGSLPLQRPVVGITPTTDHGGYWLVASDGGIFSFGDTNYFGSIPGLGLHPAGSGLPHSLNAPIVGMVPSADGGGYFMVAADGGVFAFGDANFEGSCPSIGGCAGTAVAVMPDASGHGYWLVTKTGGVYTFGDAPYFGAPGNTGSPVTAAVRTPDGGGYWVLVANGTIYNYGDAQSFGSPGGTLGGLNFASAIVSTADGEGYWVTSAPGAVDAYGDAPNDGSVAGTKLNGSIIAASGW